MAKPDAGFVVLRLTLCLGTVILIAFGYQCNPLRKTFYVAENHALRGFTYARRPVRSSVICRQICSLDERCKSINFNDCNKTCEMNLATRREHPGNFSASQGSVYLDDDADTPRYSLNGTSDCMVLDDVTSSDETRTTSEQPSATSNQSSNGTDTPDSATDMLRSTDITDCQEWLDAGYNTSDVYTIYPMQYQNGLQVYCDMKTNGSRWMGLQGGWIVFQRRQDGSVNFTRSWAEYRYGFGNLTGEFWLGNEYLRQLTGDGRWELLVELLARRPDTSLVRYLAWYQTFSITGEQYALQVGNHNEMLRLAVCDVAACVAVGDSLTTKHNNQDFSTYDRDNDNDAGNNCAEKHHGGWWFNKCQPTTGFNFNPDVTSNLNGEYSTVMGGSDNPANLRWKKVPSSETIYTSEMKMRKG